MAWQPEAPRTLVQGGTPRDELARDVSDLIVASLVVDVNVLTGDPCR
jgi:hypothetical protein